MHDHEGSVWEEYWAILTDPAHFLAELTFTFIDILILSPLLFLLWRLVKTKAQGVLEARVAKEHAALDAEHGVNHEEASS